MSDYEERKQARIDRYRERAEQARQESRELSRESISMLEHIPPGQPILVGHHSERGHRKLLERSDRKMEQSIAASEKAAYYEHKAEAAERNTAIFSDDPEALTKLNKKLKSLQVAQTRMKQINAYYRKHGTCQGFHGLSDEQAEKLDDRVRNGYSWEKAPYPAYALSNIQQLAQFRTSHSIYADGALHFVYADFDCVAFVRFKDNSEVLTAVNRGEKEISFRYKGRTFRLSPMSYINDDI